jgi:hypothetical protein
VEQVGAGRRQYRSWRLASSLGERFRPGSGLTTGLEDLIAVPSDDFVFIVV